MGSPVEIHSDIYNTDRDPGMYFDGGNDTVDRDNRIWRANLRKRKKIKECYPWRHFWLPSRRRSSIDMDSEDDMPNRDRIAGKNYNAALDTDGRYHNTVKHSTFVTQRGLLEAKNPSIAPHYCDQCGRLQVDLRRVIANWLSHPVGWKISEKETGLTLADVLEGAGLGCHLFQELVSEYMSTMNVFKKWSEKKCIAQMEKDDYKLVSTISMKEKPSLEFRREARGAMYDGHRMGLYQIYTPTGVKPSHGVFLDRLPPNLLPNSQLAFCRIQSWIDDCRVNHFRCQSFGRTFMPKRLLEISGGGEVPTVRLSTHELTDESPPHYATLSYCWGTDQPSKTLKDNIQAYEIEIPFDALPKTIQDAIIVTRGIGLSYLWVDALCIIQDDKDDKQEQIALMHSIFRGSWVTIAAAEAVRSTDGFLQPRNLGQPTKLKARFDDNVFSEIALYHETIPSDPSNSALCRRGWTYQETQLSTRILFYDSPQLKYICIEGMHSDGGNDPRESLVRRSIDPGNQKHERLDHPYSWGAIVDAYTQRDLSYEDDKLLAIAALAEEYSQAKNVGRYLAGMWEVDFLRQCLWTVWSHYMTKYRRPSKYRAPSWSWASWDGEITDVDFSKNPELERRTYQFSCDLVDVQTSLVASEYQFGMVSDGFMVIRGKMRQVICGKNKMSHMPERIVGHMFGDTTGNWLNKDGIDQRLFFDIDFAKEWTEDEDILVWSIEICQSDYNRGYALLVKEKELDHRRNIFERIGRLTIIRRDYLPDWFETSFEWREITIV